uniref:RanBP2-type domain-containing protein n=1 Tax=Moschus moschiferus TaxID=68415 RepID=A0A8C6ECU2_MOSMO
MALKPEDPSSGFWHGKVMAFINERMSRHAKGPEFYLENLSLSWEKVEDKFRAILEDRQVPIQAKEACAWGSLALGMRFACRQSQLHGHRVQWLHDLAGLHKSAAHALASDLKLLMAQHEVECKESAFQLQQMQANLEKMRKERDQLRWKLFQAGPGLAMATASGAETEGTSEEEEEEAGATATPAAASEATRGGRQEDAEGAGAAGAKEAEEAAEEMVVDIMQLLRVVDQKNHTSGGQRKGDRRSTERARRYLFKTTKPMYTASPGTLPVQLPTSFTYSYSSSPFPDAPTPSTPTPSPSTSSSPPAGVTVGAPAQASPHCSPFNFSLGSNAGAWGKDPQEPTRNWGYSDPHQQRKPTAFRRPGDWNCPWCKALNFSRQKICFRCGRDIWLQNP